METELLDCLKERVAYSALMVERDSTSKELAVDELYVRGFASLNVVDRDGDMIDPKLFDVKTFMKNPQLWINHGLWQDGNGNGHSIGVVEEMHPVSVSVDEKSKTFKMHSLDTGDVYRENVPLEPFDSMKNGSKGLWVVCKILQPEVTQLVKDGRLNAFSWQGTMYRKKDGRIARIDVYEASLVNVPAGQLSLLQIGKSLRMESTNGTVVNLDLDAVSSLLPGTGERKGVHLTDAEAFLLGREATPKAIEPKAASITDADNTTTKGGDSNMEELLKKMNEQLEAMSKAVGELPAISKSLTELDTRVKAIETPAEKPEDEAAKKAAEEAEVKAKAAEEEAKKSAETTVASLTTALTAISEQLKDLPEIKSAVDNLGTRVSAIEKKPNASKAATDGDSDEDKAKQTQEAVQKALSALSAAERSQLKRNALAGIFVPDSVAKRGQ